MILYVCDPAKNTECKGRKLCGNLCTVTKHEKYAMRDKNGEPLIEYSEEYPEDEETETITVSKGCLKARKGRFVVYDVEYLKNHIEQEAAIYGRIAGMKKEHDGCVSCRFEDKKEPRKTMPELLA